MTDSWPELDWPVWLARDEVSPDAKAVQLARYVSARGKLPDGCDSLWTETPRLAGPGRGAAAVFPQLIQRLESRQLARLLSNAPEVHLRSSFAGLVVVAASETTWIPVLSKFVAALDEDQLILLVRELRRLSGIYPTGEGELGRRLLVMLQGLPDRPKRFWSRLAALRAGARLLPRGHDRVGAWRQFQDAFESFIAACQAKARGRSGAGVATGAETALRGMVVALAQAMPGDWYPDDAQASGKRRLLGALLTESPVPGVAPPHNFSELLAEGIAARPRTPHQCLRLWDADEQGTPADMAAVTTAAETASSPVSSPAGRGLGEGRETGNPFRPPSLPVRTQPAECSADSQPQPDDRLLFHFLTAPASQEPLPPSSPPLPDRWQRMPADARRRWLRLALTAYLQTCSREGGTVVLVAEPEIGPLFAYGVARLLPQPWRSRVRCEAPADEGARGAAASNEPAQALESVVDTWMDPAALLPSSEGYAELILDDGLLAEQADPAQLGAASDPWLQPWAQARVQALAQLQELAAGELTARRLLTGTYDPSDLSWRQSRVARAHVQTRIRQCLKGQPNSVLLDQAAKSPAVFQLLVNAALKEGDDVSCRAAIRSLVERVASLDSLEESLPSGAAARAFKLHALRHYVSTYKRLPYDCGWLWRERPSAGQAEQQPLLFDVLSSSPVTWDVIRTSLDAVPAEGLGLLFCGVLTTQTEGSAKQEVLAGLAARPELDLIELLAKFGTDLLIHCEDVQDMLAARIEQMLDRLYAFPDRFPSLADVLETARRLCEGGERQQNLCVRIKAWQELRRILQTQRERAKDPTTRLLTRAGLRPRSDLRFAEEICKCLDRAYPQQTHSELRSREVASLAAFVVAVARQEGLDGQLPAGFPKLLSQYFRRGKNGLLELRRYHQTLTIRLIVKRSAVIAAACGALALLAAVCVLAAKGCGDSSSGSLADRTSPAELPAGDEQGPQKAPPDPAVGQGSAEARLASESAADSAVETLAVGPAATAPADEANDPAPVLPAAAESEGEAAPPSPGSASAKPEARAEESFLFAASPLQDLSAGVDGKSVELYRGPIPDGATFQLHGKSRLLPLPPLKTGNGRPVLNRAIAVETRQADGQLEVTVRFANGEPSVTIATFRRATDRAGVVGSLAKVPQTPDRDLGRLQEQLRFCVLGVHPPAGSPPQFLALTRPDRDTLHLDPSGAVVVHHAQDARPPRLPNWPGGDELYLGGCQLTGPAGEKLEFGTTWQDESRRKDWPAPDLARAFGFGNGKLVLDSRRGLVMLMLNLWPREFELRDQRAEALAPFLAKQEKVKDLKPADRELSQLLNVDYLAAPTKPALRAIGKYKDARTDKYEADQTDVEWNRELMRGYEAARARHARWLKYTLNPKKLRYLSELQAQVEQIEAKYREPLAHASVREAAYKTWLESSPEVRVSVYRLVPYESSASQSWIRVLVVESAR